MSSFIKLTQYSGPDYPDRVTYVRAEDIISVSSRIDSSGALIEVKNSSVSTVNQNAEQVKALIEEALNPSK